MQINIHPDAGMSGFLNVVDKLRDLAVEIDGVEGVIVRTMTLGRPRVVLRPVEGGAAFIVELGPDSIVTYL